MKKLAFTKMHGTGNDFLVINALRAPVKISPSLAQKLCDRRFGAGADQILFLEPSKKADFRMRIMNADGSEVEMCGNGIRCVARFALERGHTRKTDLVFETKAGLIRPSVRKSLVRVDMGRPILDAAKIPTQAKGRVVERALSFSHKGRKAVFKVTAVSMGNPHAVIFVDDLDETDVEFWGPVIENHPFFPKRVNVEFVQVMSPEAVRVRVWERGAGLTMACGTGACAVAVAGVLTGRLRRHVEARLPGGALRIEWADNDRVIMTGPAAFVYDGIFSIE